MGLKCVSPRICYSPIFKVVNPNKPGKLRIVFDIKAKENCISISLNTKLLKGPDKLLAELHTFRVDSQIIQLATDGIYITNIVSKLAAVLDELNEHLSDDSKKGLKLSPESGTGKIHKFNKSNKEVVGYQRR